MLDQLVKERREQLEKEQQELFKAAKHNFLNKLASYVGEEFVNQLSLTIFSRRSSMLYNDNYYNVEGVFTYNDRNFHIEISDNEVTLHDVNDNSNQTYKNAQLNNLKDKLIDYLASLKPFHQTVQ